MPRIQVRETYIINGVIYQENPEYYGERLEGNDEEKMDFIASFYWRGFDDKALITIQIYGDPELVAYSKENGYGVVKDRSNNEIIFKRPTN